VDKSWKNGFGFDNVRVVLVLTGEVRLKNCKSLSIMLERAVTLLSRELYAANTQAGTVVGHPLDGLCGFFWLLLVDVLSKRLVNFNVLASTLPL